MNSIFNKTDLAPELQTLRISSGLFYLICGFNCFQSSITEPDWRQTCSSYSFNSERAGIRLLKGTVDVVSSDPWPSLKEWHVTDTKPIFNLYLNNNVKDIVVFLAWKFINIFCRLLCSIGMRMPLSRVPLWIGPVLQYMESYLEFRLQSL